MRPPHSGARAAFTLIEILIALSLLAILAGIATPKVQGQLARARDARRVQDLQVMQEAIERFHEEQGRYPAMGATSGGWDVSYDGEFAPELITAGHLREPLADPGSDTGYHFRYRLYSQGANGCFGSGPYYVLGLVAFETDHARDRFFSTFRCAGKDWADDFEYAVGGGATFTQPGTVSGPGLVGR